MTDSNKNIILIMGVPATGKSVSLRNLPQKDLVYINTDLKELPFKDSFMQTIELKAAEDLTGFINQIEGHDPCKGVVLDTLTFAMDMFESQRVIPFAGTPKGQTAWGDYAQFYKNFIHSIKAGSKDYIIMAHDAQTYNEETMEFDSQIPIKGSVGKRGAEADFTIILTAKQVPIKKLKQHENPLLNITPEEEEDGFKYVFQTRPYKGSGSKCRSPLGLWDRSMLYIDNDASAVLKRVKEYYA